MFYSIDLLTKKGYLAPLWKEGTGGKAGSLRKKEIDKADIIQLCNSVIQPKEPLALRLQATLMLGATRINDRKSKYLLKEANDFSAKVKTHRGRNDRSGIEEVKPVNADRFTFDLNNTANLFQDWTEEVTHVFFDDGGEGYRGSSQMGSMRDTMNQAPLHTLGTAAEGLMRSASSSSSSLDVSISPIKPKSRSGALSRSRDGSRDHSSASASAIFDGGLDYLEPFNDEYNPPHSFIVSPTSRGSKASSRTTGVTSDGSTEGGRERGGEEGEEIQQHYRPDAPEYEDMNVFDMPGGDRIRVDEGADDVREGERERDPSSISEGKAAAKKRKKRFLVADGAAEMSNPRLKRQVQGEFIVTREVKRMRGTDYKAKETLRGLAAASYFPHSLDGVIQVAGAYVHTALIRCEEMTQQGQGQGQGEGEVGRREEEPQRYYEPPEEAYGDIEMVRGAADGERDRASTPRSLSDRSRIISGRASVASSRGEGKGETPIRDEFEYEAPFYEGQGSAPDTLTGGSGESVGRMSMGLPDETEPDLTDKTATSLPDIVGLLSLTDHIMFSNLTGGRNRRSVVKVFYHLLVIANGGHVAVSQEEPYEDMRIEAF